MPADDLTIAELLASLCDETISTEEMRRLDRLILVDAAARRQYLEYLDLHARLSYSFHRPAEPGNQRQGMAGSPAVQVGLHDLESHISDSPFAAPFPALSTTHYPLPTNFVGGPVFSYMVATLILGVMLISAWAYTITHFQSQIVETPKPTVPSDVRPGLVFVGRITGMKDCRWADPRTEAYAGASVPLNRRYALSSGLMEITYKTGAKVILEGPCTYLVESRAGGYLALGKLTARIEERAKSQAANHNPPLSPLPSPLFSVRTPTAIVTDLGTEFGVEVNQAGETVSYVFRGMVKVAAVDDASSAVVLGENESARVVHKGSDGKFVVSQETTGETPRFIRSIWKQRRGYIDLADIVAGGDGFGRARGRGIDAVNGRVVLRQSSDLGVMSGLHGDARYHAIEELPFVDGVFVPDGGEGPVQITSAGHRTSNFIDTSNKTWNYLWAGQIITAYTPKRTVSCWLGNANYASRRHSVLSIPPNKGITFDLNAIRRQHSDVQLVRFTATAGNTEMRSDNPQATRVSADLWVFVDGKLRFSKTDVNSIDGEFVVDIPLAPSERFLTLATTDAGNGSSFDWTIFGDPCLEIIATIDNRTDGRHETQPADATSGKEGVPMEQ